jgi:hypothetical protein
MEDVTLSNGVFLPRGIQIGFPLRSHFNPKVYSEPDKFNGYRYVKMADLSTINQDWQIDWID